MFDQYEQRGAGRALSLATLTSIAREQNHTRTRTWGATLLSNYGPRVLNLGLFVRVSRCPQRITQLTHCPPVHSDKFVTRSLLLPNF